MKTLSPTIIIALFVVASSGCLSDGADDAEDACASYGPLTFTDGTWKRPKGFVELTWMEPVDLMYRPADLDCPPVGEHVDWRIAMGPGGGWSNFTADPLGHEFTPPHIGSYQAYPAARDGDGTLITSGRTDYWMVQVHERVTVPGQGGERIYPIACCIYNVTASMEGPMPGWEFDAYFDDDLLASHPEELRLSGYDFREYGDAYKGDLRIVATPTVPTVLDQEMNIDIQVDAIGGIKCRQPHQEPYC